MRAATRPLLIALLSLAALAACRGTMPAMHFYTLSTVAGPRRPRPPPRPRWAWARWPSPWPWTGPRS